MVDAASARKYYHFVRLMGRAASHIALEVALQTHPQAALVCEEVAARRLTLACIVGQARAHPTRLLRRRAATGDTKLQPLTIVPCQEDMQGADEDLHA